MRRGLDFCTGLAGRTGARDRKLERLRNVLMAISDEFVNYMVGQLDNWADVSVRKMFGGAGLYCDGAMFGLIADDVAYLKVDDSNREDFIKAGSSAFNPYPDKAKTVVMSYYEIPADVMENPDQLAKWAQRSLAVAQKKKSK
jgi:DNA transformation protein